MESLGMRKAPQRPLPDQTNGRHQKLLTLVENLVGNILVRETSPVNLVENLVENLVRETSPVNAGDTTGMAAENTRGGARPASPRSTPTTRSVPTTDRSPIMGSVPTTDRRFSPVTSFERDGREYRSATSASASGPYLLSF